MNKPKRTVTSAALEPLSPRERGRDEGAGEAKRHTKPEPSSDPSGHLLPKGERIRPYGRYSRESGSPAPWPTVSIGELFDIGAGKSVTPSARGGERSHPFLRTSNVFWGRIDVSEVSTMHFSDEEIDTKALRNGDLLVCEGGDIGRSAIWNGELQQCSFQNHLHRLRPKQKSTVPLFVMYYLQAGFTQLGIYEGAGNKTTIPNLSRSRLAELRVPTPPNPEQQKIAAVLWKLQRAIATQDRLIAATRDLKQSAMQHLFTHGLRGEPLKDTEIGPIPLSWIAIKGAELFKLTSGSLRPKELSPVATVEKPYPVLGGNGVMGYADSFLIDQDKIIVIGRVGEYCGATHLASGKVWITDNALYVKQWIFEGANADFVSQYLTHYDLNRFKRQAGQPLVTQGTINDLLFALPATAEQRDIAAALATIDRKLAHHQKKRTALDDLFQTTLHQLMTAQIRVADLDIDISEVTTPQPQGAAA